MQTKIVQIIGLILMSLSITQVINAQENQSVNGLTYAPYFQQTYNYVGKQRQYDEVNYTVFEEVDPSIYRDVQLQFPPDENGYYQFSMEDSQLGNITYVYQITENGVYEQAYFETGNDSFDDLRSHSDVHDDTSSLILPANIYPGLRFNRGYYNEEVYVVLAIYAEMTFEGITYQNVIELRHEDGLDSNWKRHIYLVPNQGIISEGFGNALVGEYEENLYLISYLPNQLVNTFTLPDAYSEVNAEMTSAIPYQYAVVISDLGAAATFVRENSEISKVNLFPDSLAMDFLQDNEAGSKVRAYTSRIGIKQVETRDIMVHSHPVLCDNYDIAAVRPIKVNTKILSENINHQATDTTLDQDAPIYLYYNVSGGISLAVPYFNEDGSDIHYVEMIR